jgi:hypothetical protein
MWCLSSDRIDAHGKVIDGQLQRVLRDGVKAVPIRQDLVVRDHDVGRHAQGLEPDPVLERAEQVADMQPSRRAIAGQDAVFRGRTFKILFQLFAPFQCGLK